MHIYRRYVLKKNQAKKLCTKKKRTNEEKIYEKMQLLTPLRMLHMCTLISLREKLTRTSLVCIFMFEYMHIYTLFLCCMLLFPFFKFMIKKNILNIIQHISTIKMFREKMHSYTNIFNVYT